MRDVHGAKFTIDGEHEIAAGGGSVNANRFRIQRFNRWHRGAVIASHKRREVSPDSDRGERVGAAVNVTDIHRTTCGGNGHPRTIEPSIAQVQCL